MTKKIMLTIAMCLGIFIVMLDTTIMNITLPAIQKGLGVKLDQLSWTINVYTIIFASCTIPLSKIADIYGKGRLFVLGLLLFGIGSLLSGLANGFSQLILGRIISSFGAAILLPVGNSLGISSWEVKDRFKIVAALGLMQGGAAAIGPTLGGILTDTFSWHWIFFINLPIIIIATCLMILSYHFKSEEKIESKIDFAGSFISMLGLFLVTLGLIKIRDWGAGDWRTLGCLITFLLSLFAFIILEKHSKSPMINLNLFKIREFTASALVALLAQFFYIGVIVILPTFFTTIQGKTELDAALILLPMSLVVFICGGLGSLVINQLGPRLLVFVGLTAILLSYLLIVSINPNKVMAMALTTLILGIGFGIIAGPVNVLAASTLQGELLTASQSVIGVVRQIGSVLGVTVFISMVSNNMANLSQYNHSSMVEAYISIYKIWIPCLLIFLVLSFLFPKKKRYLEGLTQSN
ncbi:MAG: MFS transporter [Streptococcus mutans]|nr:MFS transporter [Streptococcus mutans]RKW02928.1 MAG: MFS transporter [Streptococcus sp.]AYO48630.1 MFS transporter [Streptococcus mutans]EMB54143.1 putative MDR permease [Streptococcus mutans 11A1]EMB59833.1 putative MDR permease [Streptococcus mutans 15JP3]EMB92027.1 putative MDR permease [Streptococcus mutans A19]